VLRSALKGLGDRVRLAFIYGSMATGKDKPASDLDLIVVGDLTFSELTSALHSAQEIIGREINPTVYPPSEFKKKLHMDHHFLTSVLKEPRIFLIGDDRELARLGQKRLAYGA